MFINVLPPHIFEVKDEGHQASQN